MKCFFSFLLFACVISIQMDVRACVKAPKEPTIDVFGAQPGSGQNYYVVEIPAQGKTTVTIEGKGQTPCPTDEEQCKCDDETQAPKEKGDPRYTFTYSAGKQDSANGPIIKWNVDSSTSPGEYKFKVIKIEQDYECPPGWTGVKLKSNKQSSDEVTIYAVKIELDYIDIVNVGSNNVKHLSNGDWEIRTPEISILGSAKFRPLSAESSLVGKVSIRLIQDVKTVRRKYLRLTPPTGHKVDSGGNYLYDSLVVSTIGTTVVLGGIGGAFYEDSPWLPADPVVYKKMDMSDIFKVHLQYSFNSGPWKTVGVRYWSASGEASGPPSGNWTGSATSSLSGPAVVSTDEPVWSPIATSLLSNPQDF